MAQTFKILCSVFLAAFLLTSCTDSAGDRYIGLAQCLTEKGVKMYGGYRCPACAKQKKMFGNQSFKKINYIECDPHGENSQSQLCLAKNIEGYPTWEFSDGDRAVGIQQLETLASKTQCHLSIESK